MTENRRGRYLYYIGYGILLLLAYIIQSTPFMLPVSGVYPSLLLVVTIVAGIHESNLTAAVFGLFAGMLADINVSNGSGLHAVLYLLFALCCSLLMQVLFQNNIASTLAVGGGIIFIGSIVEFLTKSRLTDGAFAVYLNYFFKSGIYSFVVLIPVYFTFRKVFSLKRIKEPPGIYPKKLAMEERHPHKRTDDIK